MVLLGVVLKVRGRSFSTGFLYTLAGLALLLIAVESSGRLWWRYVGHEAFQNFPDENGFIRQSSGMTCSPAAAAMLLHCYGLRVSEGEMAYRAGTSFLGTDAFSEAHAVHSLVEPLGLKAVASHKSYDDCLRDERPFLAHVHGVNEGHALLVQAMTPEAVAVLDPADGLRRQISRSEFERIWDGTAIEVVEK